jgi:hypothetical protein
MNNQKGSGSTNLSLGVHNNDGSSGPGYITLVVWGGSSHTYVSYDGSIDDGNWHHIAATTTSSAQNLYLDGVLVRTESNTFSNAASSDIFTLGSLNKASEFAGGYMCNAGVWAGVLTQPQIKSIMWKQYADLTTTEKTHLVSWWNLDSTVKDGLSLVYDENNTTLGADLWSITDPIGPDTLGGADGDKHASMDLSDVGLAAGDVIKISATISGSDGGRIICPDTGAGSNGVTLITGEGSTQHSADGDIERYAYVSDVTGVLKIRTDHDSGDSEDDRTQQISNIKVQKITNAGRLI